MFYPPLFLKKEISMKYIVNNIVTSIHEGKEGAVDKFLSKTGFKKQEVSLFKSSVDARRQNVSFVSSVMVDTENKKAEEIIKRAGYQYSLKKDGRIKIPTVKNDRIIRPVIAGFGPAGMFCALILARANLKPIVIERGQPIDKRTEDVNLFWQQSIFNRESNVQFGEGGAGTFSDGKLTTRINDSLCSFILEEFVNFGAPSDILTKAKPHVGTDYLKKVVKNLREEIVARGGEVRFNEALVDIKLRGGKVYSAVTSKEEIFTDSLFLAIGHSARDTFEMLEREGFAMISKGFSIGVRIEQRQEVIDRGLYGRLAGHKNLPVGEYQLSERKNNRGVYTFCMCPGGVVVNAASEENTVVTNGMSYYKRDLENANSALAVSVFGDDFNNDWKKAVEFQRKLEKSAFEAGGKSYKAPFCTVGEFLGRGRQKSTVKPSFTTGVENVNLRKLCPDFMADMLELGLNTFNRRLNGFSSDDAVMTGFETRTSSPVRIVRDEAMQAVDKKGVYPLGEGAGYAGGIVSAAVDGIRGAMSFLENIDDSRSD